MNKLDTTQTAALEKVWDEFEGDITTEYGLMELESAMHRVLLPNCRELNKLRHDILIQEFIREKLQDFDQSHERSTSPNTYYGACT